MIDLVQNDDGTFGMIDYGRHQPGESDDYAVVDCTLEGCIEYLIKKGCSADDVIKWLKSAHEGVVIEYTGSGKLL